VRHDDNVLRRGFPAEDFIIKAADILKNLDAATLGYLDGRISKEDALEWLEHYALESPEQAEKSVDFWNQYRRYVINYSLGHDIIINSLENTAGTDQSLGKKWQIFYNILSTPRMPSGLERSEE